MADKLHGPITCTDCDDSCDTVTEARRRKWTELLADGLEILWNDWCIAEISFRPTNPIHWCIVSNLRDDGRGNIDCTIMNPTYDSMENFVKINALAHFRIIKVIEEVREKSWNMPTHTQIDASTQKGLTP